MECTSLFHDLGFWFLIKAYWIICMVKRIHPEWQILCLAIIRIYY